MTVILISLRAQKLIKKESPTFSENYLQKLPMTIQQYLSKINTLYLTGNAREHAYRGDLQSRNFTI